VVEVSTVCSLAPSSHVVSGNGGMRGMASTSGGEASRDEERR
jgi:hypothetical protein